MGEFFVYGIKVAAGFFLTCGIVLFISGVWLATKEWLNGIKIRKRRKI